MKDLIPRNIDLEKKPKVGTLVADEKRESISPNRFANVQMTSFADQSLTKTIKVSKDGFQGTRNTSLMQYNSEVVPVKKIEVDPSTFLSQD